MYDFVFSLPTKVYFGSEQLKYLPTEVNACGDRVLMVYDGASIKKRSVSRDKTAFDGLYHI